ncbi:MAG: CHAP domain-containing protein [Alphaproteobacteria bacterium]|nr:CHAP domain-containing protein [Alphaproteobacteria bacterium]
MAPLPQERGTNHVEINPGQALLQCVPYAREHSAIKISGDAWTWWSQAAGKYERGQNPAQGTVMVLFNYAGPQRGHVAVVRRVVSSREIRIDHANWLDDGAIYVNDPVVDVSAANDWSEVKVWNIKTGGWGIKVYPVQGFIGAGSSAGEQEASPRNPSPDDEDTLTPDQLVASLAPDDADEAPAPRAPAAKPKTLRTAARATRGAGVMQPAAMIRDDRNPAPDSGFALTAEDLAIP